MEGTVRVADDPVDTPRGDRRRRAQRALIRGQLEGRAVGGHRGPPVQHVAAARGQREPVTGDRRDRHIAQHRDGEAGDGHGQIAKPTPPAPRDQDREDNRRDDEQLTDLPDVSGEPQHQRSRRQPPEARPGAPQQDGEAGEDEGLEGDVGHDGLLHLELVGVQQDGGRREGGGPAGRATADEQSVDGDAHGQAEQVLEAGHHGQVAQPQDGLEQDVVADRVGPAAAGQVLVGVDVEERGPVGDLGDHAQPEPRGQHYEQRPMTADGAAGPPAAPGDGVIRAWRSSRRCRNRAVAR
ncbi:MAG: hypothetical protein ACLPQY_10565 [Streptosporangiaceae bacterium]